MPQYESEIYRKNEKLQNGEYLPSTNCCDLEMYIILAEKTWRNKKLPQLIAQKKNLSRYERTSLIKLQKDSCKIIKPADKGSSIVIQNFSAHREEILHQLSDGKIFIEIPTDPTPQLCRTLEVTIDCVNAEGTINKRLANFLRPHNPQVPVIYTLPKIKNILFVHE